MEVQTLIVTVVVAVAAYYVGRSLWRTWTPSNGCQACRYNRTRADDYV
ncbi:MAG: hypothetical protein NZ578_07330 [Candidatus Binatia bacterium]|nr:hypothetical protein [Candidatus Binatia bacterium]